MITLLSKAFVPTTKEEPSGAENESHRLLLRAGYIRQSASGVYHLLHLAKRVVRNIERVLREEMDRIGAQEVLLASLSPEEPYADTGRLSDFGDDMFRLKDRKNRALVLCPTHEEPMTCLAREAFASYRDLPQSWYHIQTKFRDEARPRGGLLRVREFSMKDSYSFDADEKGMETSFRAHRDAYREIFKRCRLPFVEVEASSGVMGGSGSTEFMLPSASGESAFLACECGYAANEEAASSTPAAKPVPSPFKERKRVHTPNVKTVEEVATFLGCSPTNIMKSLLFISDEVPTLALTRGDTDVSEAKVKSLLSQSATLATPEEVRRLLSVDAGFVGPLDTDARIIADETTRGMEGAVVGANENDHHVVGVSVEEDVPVSEFADIRAAREGDSCPRCSAPLSGERAVELGHIFMLGTKYSEPLGLRYADESGALKPVHMGSYGIGVGRLLSAVVESHRDERGIVWPVEVAPYPVTVVDLDPERCSPVSSALAETLSRAGTDTLVDDRRGVTPGFKFKDAELVGVPLQLIVGPKGVKRGELELVSRDGSVKRGLPAGDPARCAETVSEVLDEMAK